MTESPDGLDSNQRLCLWVLFVLVSGFCVVLVVTATLWRGEPPKEMKGVVAFLNKAPRRMKLLWWVVLLVSLAVSLVNSIRNGNLKF